MMISNTSSFSGKYGYLLWIETHILDHKGKNY